jgi:hypothetical protein
MMNGRINQHSVWIPFVALLAFVAVGVAGRVTVVTKGFEEGSAAGDDGAAADGSGVPNTPPTAEVGLGAADEPPLPEFSIAQICFMTGVMAKKSVNQRGQ